MNDCVNTETQPTGPSIAISKGGQSSKRPSVSSRKEYLMKTMAAYKYVARAPWLPVSAVASS